MSAESKQRANGRRVVITGVGVVTALGQTAESLWKACLAGCSGITPISGFDVSSYTTRFAGEIKEWDPSPFMDRKEARRMDRFVQFAVAAAAMALEDSGLSIDE
ncbi:MAG TPA: beta-ketoacyl synthase N-terminal-like domain-containing protein, partial [Chthonomonadaceae bacterium]|nr:beta-ketoacyl synthase N-terminal-like domain-containing protein [Chthonomonadaceae bacterium]